MQKIAFYFRVSSDEQAGRGTIQNQIEFAEKYADLHSFIVSKKYIDDGVTGTLPLEMRPEGYKLLEDAKAYLFDTLYIYKLDRLGRSARVVINAIHELESLGIKIKSMTEPFDTESPSGRLHVNMLASFADFERSTFLERSALGTNRRAREGKWLGGIVPYGYFKNAEGYLEISEEPLPGHTMSEAEVIRLIYKLIGEQGYTTLKVADYLNALSIPPSYTKDGRKLKKSKRKVATAGMWRPGRVRNMIVNSTYKGIHVYGKRTKKVREAIERKVPAIVSEELWERANKQLKDNFQEAFRNQKRQYLLRGLVKCGVCGLTYHGTAFPSYKKGIKAYYVCGGKNKYRGPYKGKCPSRNVPAEWIEELVWNHIISFIENPGETLLELSKAIDGKKDKAVEFAAERVLVSQALLEKDNEKQMILDLYRRQQINPADVEMQLQKIKLEEEGLKVRLRELSALVEDEEDISKQFDTAEALLMHLRSLISQNLPFEVKRMVVKTLVDEIIVETEPDPDGSKPRANVRIRYSFSKDVLHTGTDSWRQPT